jgi:hypothetical protein
MAYDYHGGWEDKTGHNAPVYARPEEVGNDRISNVVSCDFFAEMGVLQKYWKVWLLPMTLEIFDKVVHRSFQRKLVLHNTFLLLTLSFDVPPTF